MGRLCAKHRAYGKKNLITILMTAKQYIDSSYGAGTATLAYPDDRTIVETEHGAEEKPGALEALLSARAALPTPQTGEHKQTLQEIADSLNTTPAGLFNKVFDLSQEFSAKVQLNDEYGLSSPWHEYLDTLYNLYHYGSSREWRVPEAPWIENLHCFESYVEHFVPQATPEIQRRIMKQVQDYIESRVHPQSIFSIDKWRLDEFGQKALTVYAKHGEWLLIPCLHDAERPHYDFATRNVLEEAIKLSRLGCTFPILTHEGSSAALDGISQHLALLCSSMLRELGTEIRSGEAVSLGSWLHGNVYASPGEPWPTAGYKMMRWFDEYPVGFGIDPSMLKSFQRETRAEMDSETAKRWTIGGDWEGNGRTLGPKVPLECVKCVYCWKANEEEMRTWAARNTPWADVVSFEAVGIITWYGLRAAEIAKEEGLSLLEVWERLI